MIDISHRLKPGSVELLARASELPVRTNKVGHWNIKRIQQCNGVTGHSCQAVTLYPSGRI